MLRCWSSEVANQETRSGGMSWLMPVLLGAVGVVSLQGNLLPAHPASPAAHRNEHHVEWPKLTSQDILVL